MDRYFKFVIPKNKDGTPVSYSFGWHGTMPVCPKGKVVIDLYNDDYGIAHEVDATSFIPKEISILSATERSAVKIIKPALDIYNEKQLLNTVEEVRLVR